MGTTLNLYQREISAEHGTGIDVHLICILQGLARWGVSEDKHIGAFDFSCQAVLRVGDALAVPDNLLGISWLVEFVFVVWIVGMANDVFFIDCHQFYDQRQFSGYAYWRSAE